MYDHRPPNCGSIFPQKSSKKTLELIHKNSKSEVIKMTNKEYQILSLENRINRLENNGKENGKIVNKLRRQLRKLKAD